tara:strand:+ start:1895 stop:2857 length:963 start_codon:yes stop_codon:yes gene_type:complete
MNYKPILIVAGEPNSVFLEIFFKVLKTQKIKSPIILISSLQLLKLQMRKLGYKKKIKLLLLDKLEKYKLDNKSINLITVEYHPKKAFGYISKKTNKYIDDCFKIAFKILKRGTTYKFLNGPISKKDFLGKKFLGITEYVSHNFKIKKYGMLIYNKKLSVSTVTTHLPLKLVHKKISYKNIAEKIYLINNFFIKNFNLRPKIAVLGLNPHCESIDKFNEDIKIISPTIKKLKRKYSISGPHSADTIFMKNNKKKYNVILGMYHDQVLAPLKALYEFDAINITMGLPFLRISPDHGPNVEMMGLNKSNALSLKKALIFLDKN